MTKSKADKQEDSSYQYDALGRRINKTTPEQSIDFFWNGDVLLSEQISNTSGQENQSKIYLYEPDSFKPLAIIQDQQIYHYHLDHLGTPQELTHHNGELAWSVRYKAYGNVVRKEVEAIENNLRFQGQYYDIETGLHYNRHRYYDPTTARFISLDPIGLLGGNNNYEYTKNPTAWIDPLGLAAKAGDCRKPEAGDVAKLHKYDLNSGPHYSVEVNGIQTDQIIIDASRNTTIRNTKNLPAPSLTRNFEIPDSNAANTLQKKLLGADTGKYSVGSNSCLHHCADVLKAGGSKETVRTLYKKTK